MSNDFADLTFEQAFAELQGVMAELRGDAMTLDRSLALFERGTALSAHCTALLTAAELRITVSTADSAAGTVQLDSLAFADGPEINTEW